MFALALKGAYPTNGTFLPEIKGEMAPFDRAVRTTGV